MSSHRLSVSGQREYTITAGGGSMSAAQFPARMEDGIHVALGGVKVEIPLHPVMDYRLGTEPEDAARPSVRIERRVYKEGNGLTTQHVLVLEGNANVWAVPAGPSVMPHSNVDVRRPQADRDPINYGRELVSSEIAAELAIPESSYEHAEGALTEDNLVQALHEHREGQEAEHAPRVLAVGDQRTELVARRILHSAGDPQPVGVGEEFRARDYAKLADLPVEIDPDLGEHGWELR